MVDSTAYSLRNLLSWKLLLFSGIILAFSNIMKIQGFPVIDDLVGESSTLSEPWEDEMTYDTTSEKMIVVQENHHFISHEFTKPIPFFDLSKEPLLYIHTTRINQIIEADHCQIHVCFSRFAPIGENTDVITWPSSCFHYITTDSKSSSSEKPFVQPANFPTGKIYINTLIKVPPQRVKDKVTSCTAHLSYRGESCPAGKAGFDCLQTLQQFEDSPSFDFSVTKEAIFTIAPQTNGHFLSKFSFISKASGTGVLLFGDGFIPTPEKHSSSHNVSELTQGRFYLPRFTVGKTKKDYTLQGGDYTSYIRIITEATIKITSFEIKPSLCDENRAGIECEAVLQVQNVKDVAKKFSRSEKSGIVSGVIRFITGRKDKNYINIGFGSTLPYEMPPTLFLRQGALPALTTTSSTLVYDIKKTAKVNALGYISLPILHPDDASAFTADSQWYYSLAWTKSEASPSIPPVGIWFDTQCPDSCVDAEHGTCPADKKTLNKNSLSSTNPFLSLLQNMSQSNNHSSDTNKSDILIDEDEDPVVVDQHRCICKEGYTSWNCNQKVNPEPDDEKNPIPFWKRPWFIPACGVALVLSLLMMIICCCSYAKCCRTKSKNDTFPHAQGHIKANPKGDFDNSLVDSPSFANEGYLGDPSHSQDSYSRVNKAKSKKYDQYGYIPIKRGDKHISSASNFPTSYGSIANDMQGRNSISSNQPSSSRNIRASLSNAPHGHQNHQGLQSLQGAEVTSHGMAVYNQKSGRMISNQAPVSQTQGKEQQPPSSYYDNNSYQQISNTPGSMGKTRQLLSPQASSSTFSLGNDPSPSPLDVHGNDSQFDYHTMGSL